MFIIYDNHSKGPNWTPSYHAMLRLVVSLPGLLGPDARLHRLPSWIPLCGGQKAVDMEPQVDGMWNCGIAKLLWNAINLDMELIHFRHEDGKPPKNGLHFSFLVAIQFHGINGDSTPKSSRRS